MKSFINAVKNGEKGLVIRNSIYLPFHCELLSVWVGKEMSLLAAPELLSDLTNESHISIREGASYTNIVLRKWGDLVKELGHEKGHVILHAAEKDSDIFMPENLHYIRIGFFDRGKEISFEIIDDPFNL